MASVAHGQTPLPPGKQKKKETIYFFYWLFKFAGESCREALLPFFVGMGLAPPSGMINATGKREPPHLMLRTNWVGVCLRTLRNARTKLE